MLLNLSNHPSAKWSEAQRQAALEQYGEIRDLPFPQIPPEADTEEVRRLAEEYETQIRQLADDRPRFVVHVMGELTFTFILVNRLLSIGIPCVASASKRIVIEESGGHKISQFNFVKFRSYH